MNNPFKFGKEVSGYQFYDRRESADELYRLLKDGVANVVLYAPRRYGKTSLVVKVFENFKNDGIPCIHFDISKVSSLERFCEEYASAVYSLRGGFRETAHRILDYVAHLHPTISGTLTGQKSIRFDYGSRMSSQSISDILDLPERLAQDTGGRPIVVAFDEFQEIAELSREIPLENVFRSAIQAHRHVRYVFLGSKTHLMRRMFGERTSAFYKAAQTMKIGKPPLEESREYVVSRFSDAGLSVSPAAQERILSDSANIPYYVQAISAYAFMSLERSGGTEVSTDTVDEAVSRLLAAESDYYEEVLHGLSPAQWSVLEALAAEPTGRFDERYRERHSLPGLSTVHSSLDELVASGVLEKGKSGYDFGDPLFARYVNTLSASTVYQQ